MGCGCHCGENARKLSEKEKAGCCQIEDSDEKDE